MHRADRVYYCARQRCNNKNSDSYKNYGGRGIKCLMTKEDFRKLWARDKAEKLEKPSIDRKDVNGHYTLKNCRFIELRKNSGVRRDTMVEFCPKGHPYSGKNLYTKTSGGYINRICRTCASASRRKYNAKAALTPASEPEENLNER